MLGAFIPESPGDIVGIRTGGESTSPGLCGTRTAAPIIDAAMMPGIGMFARERSMRMRPFGWRSLAQSLAHRTKKLYANKVA